MDGKSAAVSERKPAAKREKPQIRERGTMIYIVIASVLTVISVLAYLLADTKQLLNHETYEKQQFEDLYWSEVRKNIDLNAELSVSRVIRNGEKPQLKLIKGGCYD